jgi:hemolysin activation/secretion protein
VQNSKVSSVINSLWLLAGLTVFACGNASAQGQPAVPGGALPGAMQPDLDHWDLRAQQDDELYIPPSVDRPLGEDAGPRIEVNALELSIDPRLNSLIGAELRAAVDQILKLSVIENQAGGFTIGRLERAATAVTERLREGGFILAWAYLPQQSVENKTVTIEVLSGTLEGVTVDGNNRYKSKQLLGPFNDLFGTPVVKDDVEKSILVVRNYPGLSTSAVFSPGTAVGSSLLTLRVSEDPFDFAMSADNHGTESTGENRVRADMFLYNPFGLGDVLVVNAVQTFDPAENLYGGLTYQAPFFSDDLTLTLGYSHNTFEVASGIAAGAGEGGKNLAGDTDIGWIGLSKNLRLKRRSRLDMGIDLHVKNAVLENLGSETEDNLTVASLYLSAEAVDGIGAGGINQLELRYLKGIPDFLGSMSEDGDGGQSTRTGGSGTDAGGDFDKIMVRYQRLQRISERNSLLIRAEGQVSDDLLTSLEQFVIGGPNNVRAYPIAEYLGDEGAFASLEWIVELRDTGNSSFSISAFADYAYAKLNDPLANEIDDTDLSGWGIGIAFSNTSASGNRFGFRVDVATPIGDIEPSDEDDPQIYGQISYSFR